MKKYYLKATSSTCYDKTGITFPEHISIPIENLADIFFGRAWDWRRQFGWNNQPEVLIFSTDEEKAQLFHIVINRFYKGFVVVERDW